MSSAAAFSTKMLPCSMRAAGVPDDHRRRTAGSVSKKVTRISRQFDAIHGGAARHGGNGHRGRRTSQGLSHAALAAWCLCMILVALAA